MTGVELKAIGVELYGDPGWRKGLATALKVNEATIRRYVIGEIPIQPPMIDKVRQVQLQHRRKRDKLERRLKQYERPSSHS